MPDVQSPNSCKDIQLTISNSWGVGKIGLEEWINSGYPRRVTAIEEVECRDNQQKLPIHVVPLPYRNDLLSHFLLGTELLDPIEQAWKNIEIAKLVINRKQQIGDLDIEEANDGLLLTHRSSKLKLSLSPNEFSVGVLQTGYFGFCIITDTRDWLTHNTSVVSSIGFLGTVVFSSGVVKEDEEAMQRNKHGTPFSDIEEFSFDVNGRQSGIGIKSHLHRNNLALFTGVSNITPRHSMILHAVSQTNKNIETEAIRLIHNIHLLP